MLRGARDEIASLDADPSMSNIIRTGMYDKYEGM